MPLAIDPFVVAASGQSNMEQMPAYRWCPPDNLVIWDRGRLRFGPVPKGRINLAWKVGADIAAAMPSRLVAVVKVARGDTAIHAWTNGVRYQLADRIGPGKLQLTGDAPSLFRVSHTDALGRPRINTLRTFDRSEIARVESPEHEASWIDFRVHEAVRFVDGRHVLGTILRHGRPLPAEGEVRLRIGHDMRAQMALHLPAALQELGQQRFDLLLWHQGENDAGMPDAYADDFEEMRASLTPWVPDDTPTVIFGLAPAQTASGLAINPNFAALNRVLSGLAAARPERLFVPAPAQRVLWDQKLVHLTAEGVVQLGAHAAAHLLSQKISKGAPKKPGAAFAAPTKACGTSCPDFTVQPR